MLGSPWNGASHPSEQGLSRGYDPAKVDALLDQLRSAPGGENDDVSNHLPDVSNQRLSAALR